MNRIEKKINSIQLPVLLLRGITLFPGMLLSFDIGRSKAIEAVKLSMSGDQKIFIVGQKDVMDDDPDFMGLYNIGVIAKVRQVIKQKDGIIRVLVKGERRGELLSEVLSEPYILAEIKECAEEHDAPKVEEIAALRILKSTFNKYVEIAPPLSKEFLTAVLLEENAGKIADILSFNIVSDYFTKQQLLCETNVLKRLEQLIMFLINEINILYIEEDLSLKFLNKMEEVKREYYLREQLQLISEELGEDSFKQESDELKEKVISLRLDKEIEKTLIKECNKLSKMPYGSQEANVLQNYIELCIDMPFNKRTDCNIDLNKSEEILNRDHFGLKKVKDRILDCLAARKISLGMNGQIICLVGPPGIGKTSIAKSIAEATGRKYAKISLGGMHDEADIRGHRRTYIGSMPGRIISSIRKVGSKNPLLLLDEIDKISKDSLGDPVSALLEALDPEQNNMFYDHYLDIPFDLSEVFFITTANCYDDIPTPLLDRMEVISLTSYTNEEKFNIAKNHLVPKKLKKYRIDKNVFKITDNAIREIIDCYTQESGVRELDRIIESLLRKSAKSIINLENRSIIVSTKNLEDLLGPKKFLLDKTMKEDQIGVTNGLAWTATGGVTMPIEVAIMPGVGNIEITGSIGDVMRESVQAVVSYIRSNASRLNINPEFYSVSDIHIHVPKGAVPKDGPSAGVALAVAIVSALTDIPVRYQVALTGEITLRGRVLAIGSIKEKSMAAYKAGITNLILPSENLSDLHELDEVVKKSINFIPVDNMEKAIDNALVGGLNAIKKKYTFRQKSLKNKMDNLNAVNITQ